MLHKTSVIATYTLYASLYPPTVTSLPPPKSIFGRGRAGRQLHRGLRRGRRRLGAATPARRARPRRPPARAMRRRMRASSLAASCSAVRKISFASTREIGRDPPPAARGQLAGIVSLLVVVALIDSSSLPLATAATARTRAEEAPHAAPHERNARTEQQPAHDDHLQRLGRKTARAAVLRAATANDAGGGVGGGGALRSSHDLLPRRRRRHSCPAEAGRLQIVRRAAVQPLQAEEALRRQLFTNRPLRRRQAASGRGGGGRACGGLLSQPGPV